MLGIIARLWRFLVAQFPVNAHRRDPYRNFKFQVRWDNQLIPGICRVSALRRTTEVVRHC
jgi:hypothetical protein